MHEVGPDEAVDYGLSLAERVAAVVVVGGVPVFVGLFLLDADLPILGSLLVFVGVVVFFSGLFGLLYKVVADGVARGVRTTGERADDEHPADRGPESAEQPSEPRERRSVGDGDSETIE
ncbi:hypothetical protein [Haloarchaeobius sp. DFWS5]|uniref:hypothetical protein n=1 Tax=Haloarchaeobius sp. DFWS5 TaxID=3446114 RepID=UPI003EB6C48A